MSRYADEPKPKIRFIIELMFYNKTVFRPYELSIALGDSQPKAKLVIKY